MGTVSFRCVKSRAFVTSHSVPIKPVPSTSCLTSERKDLSTRWFPTKETGFLPGVLFVDRCERVENSRFMLEKQPSRRSASWMEGWNQGRQLKTGNSKRRISRGQYLALSPPIISLSWESEIETNTQWTVKKLSCPLSKLSFRVPTWLEPLRLS